MKRVIFGILISIGWVYGQTGKEIFDTNCLSCHIMKKGRELTSIEKNRLLAPTAFGITKHTKDVYSSKDEFVKFVSDYITQPNRAKTICKDEVIEKFGLMPPIGASLSEEEKKKVTSWMFDNIIKSR